MNTFHKSQKKIKYDQNRKTTTIDIYELFIRSKQNLLFLIFKKQVPFDSLLLFSDYFPKRKNFLYNFIYTPQKRDRKFVDNEEKCLGKQF